MSNSVRQSIKTPLELQGPLAVPGPQSKGEVGSISPCNMRAATYYLAPPPPVNENPGSVPDAGSRVIVM